MRPLKYNHYMCIIRFESEKNRDSDPIIGEYRAK